MSVYVMSWVWKHSEAAGNNRLVLLAIADAADDDGRNAWPSTATLAHKTRLSVRTVRRCIGTLIDSNSLKREIRPGRSNMFQVVMEPGVPTSNPGQSVTPDKLSPRSRVTGDPGQSVTPPRSRVTADPSITVQEPSSSRPRNNATRWRKVKGAEEAAQSTESTTQRPSGLKSAKADSRSGVGEFFTQLSNAWQLTPPQASQLYPTVSQCLNRGWTPQDLAEAVGNDTNGLRSHFAGLSATLKRLIDVEPTRGGNGGYRRPEWCGECHQATRMIDDADTGLPKRCPACHPRNVDSPQGRNTVAKGPDLREEAQKGSSRPLGHPNDAKGFLAALSASVGSVN